MVKHNIGINGINTSLKRNVIKKSNKRRLKKTNKRVMCKSDTSTTLKKTNKYN